MLRVGGNEKIARARLLATQARGRPRSKHEHAASARARRIMPW